VAAVDDVAARAGDPHAVDTQRGVGSPSPETPQPFEVPGLTVSPHSLSRGNVAR
jgi:hypothetical protein